ncbi:hypothetical protein SPF06_05010 [Sinomonas sp. JGH33]|uniref:Lipid A biosynthesis acyltransferase n=1 Tax=Sinomonas terricola TaxID=3110330 RepID=A0ABU5T334_9MICC|nr:hypothetical protein [Sinomonas sp. JGH33]MEA5454078.1 hypothetical protein [Sinomonas sp. JGH33]
MAELAGCDRPIYNASAGADSRSALGARALRAMAAAPGLAREDISREAERFADYGYTMQFDMYFLSLWIESGVLAEVVTFVGEEQLDLATRAGRGALVLPLHIGPSYSAPFLVARTHPTTFVYNRANISELQQIAFPTLDVEGFPLDSGDTFRRAMRALSQGRAFSMFPEYDPRGSVARHLATAQFFGAEIDAPLGPAILSRMARCPIVPLTVERGRRGGSYTVTYHDVIAPPTDEEGCATTTQRLWKLIESELLRVGFGDWEIWFDFERMLRSAARSER